MGQQNSKLDKDKSEHDKSDDKKLFTDIEKQERKERNELKRKETIERKDKHGECKYKTSPGHQETNPGSLMMNANMRPTVNVNKDDEIEKNKAIENLQCDRELLNDKTKAKEGKFNGENSTSNNMAVNKNARQQNPEVKECKDCSGDEDITKKITNDENAKMVILDEVAKVIHDEETSEKHLSDDCFKVSNILECKTKITAHPAIMQEQKENIEMESDFVCKAYEVKSKQFEKNKNKPNCKKEDFTGAMYKKGMAKIVINLYIDYQLIIDIICKVYLQSLLQIIFGENCVDSKDNVSKEMMKFSCTVLTYAIGVPSDTLLVDSPGDQQVIKEILKTPILRNVHLQDEHFRLATFSLSPSAYNMGETLRLAAKGFFYDIDGNIKCFCCGQNKSVASLNHHQHVTGTSMLQYGTFASSMLLLNGNYTDFIQIRQRLTRIRLPGGTQVFSTVEQSVQEESNSCFSVRRGHSQSHNVQENASVSSLRPRATENVANQAVSTISAQNNEMPDFSSYFRAKNEDRPISREARPASCARDREIIVSNNEKKGSTRENLERENQVMRSRVHCRKCSVRPANIVLLPCGHLVVCDSCIPNTTECPNCGKNVEKAVHATIK